MTLISMPKEVSSHKHFDVLKQFMHHEKFLSLERLASLLGDFELLYDEDTIDLNWRGKEEYISIFIGRDVIFPTIGITRQKVEVPLFGKGYTHSNFDWDLVIFSISLVLGMRDLRDENKELKKTLLSREEEIENLQSTISASEVYTKLGQHINVIA